MLSPERIGTALTYHHLHEPDVRAAMLRHWADEWASMTHGGARPTCYGGALTEAGWAAFADAMPQALESFDDDWLLTRMHASAFWQPWGLRRRRGRGGVTRYRMDRQQANRRLCVGEFNTAYVRGLAHALRERGETHAVVYRAGVAEGPRCTAWEGMRVPLQAVIDGHRARYWPPPGDAMAFSVPSGPNCLHSIRAA